MLIAMGDLEFFITDDFVKHCILPQLLYTDLCYNGSFPTSNM